MLVSFLFFNDDKFIGNFLQTILMSASANKLSISHEEAEEHAGLVMEALDPHNLNQGYLQVSISI